MGFFDVPPRPDVDDDDFIDVFDVHQPGRWLGGVVPIEEIVGRSDTAAVAVRRVVAFEDGFELQLVAWVREPIRTRRHRRFHQEIQLAAHAPFGSRDEDGSLVAELVRFGVQFPDGAKVTNLDDAWPLSPDATEPRHGMSTNSGSGSNGEADQTFWIWPLPETGDLTLVCEWPAYNIAESRLTLAGDLLRDAAARSVPVWPDQPARTHLSPYGPFPRAGGHMAAPIGTILHDVSNPDVAREQSEPPTDLGEGP